MPRDLSGRYFPFFYSVGHFVLCRIQYSIESPWRPQNYGRLKTGWKTMTFYSSNGFGCHFQRISPIELKFYMEQHNNLNFFTYFMAPPLKMLKKCTFFATNWIKQIFTKKQRFSSSQKKCTYLAFSESGP